jgi:signal peptidase II
VNKPLLVGGVATSVLALDVATKGLVQRSFELGESLPVVGDVVRLTYILNPGAAFGISLGPHSRFAFGALTVVATAVIVLMVRRTPSARPVSLVALALILGGAVGNLFDRIRHPGGVVDFVDVGFGSLRWPIFNVADMSVTCGAILLILLLQAERPETAAEAPAAGRAPDGAPGSTGT